MRCLIALLMMTVSASAQTAVERIEPRLRQAIDEHRIFLTCSSLDPELHASVASGWRQMVAKARAYLEGRYTSLAELASFDRRTSEDAMIKKDAPLREAIELCTRAAPEWRRNYETYEFTVDITALSSTP